MNKIVKVGFALAMATALVACGSKKTSDTAKETAKAAESTAAAETSAAAESEAPATEGHYTVQNNTGEKVTELYIYLNGADKGENYAKDGLDIAGVLSVDITVKDDEAATYKEKGMTIEFVTESGADLKAFENLHLETANIFLKPAADVESGATPFIEGEGK